MTAATSSAAGLLARATALESYLTSAAGVVPEELLAPARDLHRRVTGRLRLAGGQAVVALAGPTGSGKSSLFNLLAGMALADVGVLRPTTLAPHACLWGGAQPAAGLLEWLDVPPELRFRRESALDGDDQAALRGLVLLDLPDVDSVLDEHRAEADRLINLVDLIIWVTDPQKYADHVLHERYLRAFRPHRESVIVVFNQIDTLDGPDVDRCVADLRRLLELDGLRGTPVIPTSATTAVGITEVRSRLEEAVAGRRSALVRLAGEWRSITGALAGTAGPVSADLAASIRLKAATAVGELIGVSSIATAAGQSYRAQAAGALGRPRVPVDAGPAPQPATWPRDQLEPTLERVARQAAEPLPAVWRAALISAAVSRLSELTDGLDRAVTAATEPGGPHGTDPAGRGTAPPTGHAHEAAGRRARTTGTAPVWWRALALLRVLGAVTALGGVIALLLRVFGAPVGVPVGIGLLVGGLGGWVAMSALAVPLVAAGARRRAGAVRADLSRAVGRLVDERVAGPVEEVLARCQRADRALAESGAAG